MCNRKYRFEAIDASGEVLLSETEKKVDHNKVNLGGEFIQFCSRVPVLTKCIEVGYYATKHNIWIIQERRYN